MSLRVGGERRGRAGEAGQEGRWGFLKDEHANDVEPTGHEISWEEQEEEVQDEGHETFFSKFSQIRGI